ncbi:MAG: DMT family transporter [Myxococcota bacterium]
MSTPALVLLTGATLVAFAANSLLCRMALGDGAMEPEMFTAVRLASGALALAPLAWFVRRRGSPSPAGSWGSGFALFVYAMGFSLAYVSLDTGVGALILFAAVQATMLGAGWRQGERPLAKEWLGLLTAMAGLAYLVRPGATSPDAMGVMLMVAAGVGWGVYSVRGRGAPSPTATTARNFLWSVPWALGSVLVLGSGSGLGPSRAVALAVMSGAVTSGLGYVLWYAVLRHITTTRAAIVQLSVPVLAAVAGIVVLGEAATLRFGVASAMILGGVGFAISQRQPTALAIDR